MFYWTILQKSDNELVKMFFSAQKKFPGKKKDWIRQVAEDLEYLDIKNTEEEIMTMKKQTFKSLVNEKIKVKAFEYLAGLHMKHSKFRYLCQEQGMQEYLTSNELSTREKQLLFRLRSRTTPNKTNY